MILAPPVDIPVTTPLVFTLATAVLLLLQVPPEVVSARVIADPIHTAAPPVIAPGNGFTVIVLVLRQPVGRV